MFGKAGKYFKKLYLRQNTTLAPTKVRVDKSMMIGEVKLTEKKKT